MRHGSPGSGQPARSFRPAEFYIVPFPIVDAIRRRAKNLADERRDRARSCTRPCLEETPSRGRTGEKGREDSSRRMEKRNERRPSTGQVENARPTRTRLTRAGHLDPSPLPHPIRISLSSPVSRSERIDSSMLAVARSKRPRTILWEIESGHAVFAVGRAYIFSLREIYERTAS